MQKVHITTQGCAANQAESEVMAGILDSNGYGITPQKEDADVMLINVCTVKGSKTAFKEIKATRKDFPDRKIVVAGCISKELKPMIKELDHSIVMLSTNDMLKVKEAVDLAVTNQPGEFFEKSKTEKINQPRIRANPAIGVIPISSGCNQACAYCTVVVVKGGLQSYNDENILKEASSMIKDGCKELWLTSQDTASYGLEKEKISRLPQLLQQITGIPGDFKIRVGMMNPTFVKPVLPALIEAFKSEKIYKFMHIPVQAGNNQVLDAMGRGYHVEDFKEIVAAFQKEIPGITISTDVIVGLPGESEEQFQETLDLIKALMPDVLNISRFVARPYTRAYYMKNQIHGNIKKNRSRQMAKLHNAIAYENKKKWLGWEGNVLINEVGKEGTFVARNYAYVPIIIRGPFSLGETVSVRIREISPHYLIGDVVK